MPDVIEVRPEERFDEDRLHAYLQGRLEGAESRLVVRQFGGGRANLTYLLEFASGHEYVLRRPPLGPVAPGAHDMGREYRVLSRLWEAFDKAPRALVFCDDSSVIGAPFFVMERKDGVVVREQVPDVFGAGGDTKANAALSRVVVETLGDALAPYEVEKGTIRFQLDEPVPVKLIASIAKVRAREAVGKVGKR